MRPLESEDQGASNDTAQFGSGRNRFRRIIAVTLVTSLVLVIILGWWFPVRESAAWLIETIPHYGWLAALIYIVICLPALVLGIPLTPVLIVTGVFFGLWPGLLIGYILIVGAALSGYWLARLGGLHQRRQGQSQGRWQRLQAALADQDIIFVALFRLLPTLPYGATNLLLASWGIGFAPYLFGSVIGMTPGIFINLSIGWFGGVSLTSDRPMDELPLGVVILLAVNITALFAISGLLWYRFGAILRGK